MKNLTSTQWFCIVLAILGVMGGATAQLTDLFGQTVAHDIVTASSLVSSLLSAILVALTGQGAQVKSVQAMPGVESIQINAKANPTLAALAVDPAQAKVDIAPGAESAVQLTAKAA